MFSFGRVSSSMINEDESPPIFIYFDEKTPSQLICAICMSPVYAPREMESCGHLFCAFCLKSTKVTTCCPSCKVESAQREPSKAVLRQLDDLIVKCTHHTRGCDVHMTRSQLKEHLTRFCEVEKADAQTRAEEARKKVKEELEKENLRVLKEKEEARLKFEAENAKHIRWMNPVESQLVQVNVSGQSFVVDRSLFFDFPDSVFGVLFRSDAKPECNSKGEIIVNASPKAFQMMLDFLRYHFLPCSNAFEREYFLRSMECFKIPMHTDSGWLQSMLDTTIANLRVHDNFVLKNVKLVMLSLAGRHLQSSLFSGCIFSNCDFEKAMLVKSNFVDCTFSSGGIFTSANFSEASFENCVFEDVDFNSILISKTCFSHCKFSTGTDFSKANLEKGSIEFRNCTMIEVVMDGIQFQSKCTFVESDLSKASFRGVSCENGQFEKVTAIGAHFEKSHMNQCKFVSVNLSDANFTEATCYSCVFLNTVVLRTDFSRASLLQSDLSKVSLDTALNWEGANFERSQLPREFEFSSTANRLTGRRHVSQKKKY